MGPSARALAVDEQVVLPLRTHALVLLPPAIALVVLGGVLGAGTALVPSAYRPLGQYAVALGVGALALGSAVAPFLRWWGRTYTITTFRLVTREGVLRRRASSVPLTRILDVSYEQSLRDRLLGCGTLVVQTAAEGAVVLADVPGVAHAHHVLNELILAGSPTPEPGLGDSRPQSAGRRW